MEPAIHEIKELILRLYRKLDPRSLDGLKKINDGYVTADLKWVYLIRHGGFIERETPTSTLYYDTFPLSKLQKLANAVGAAYGANITP